MNIGTEIIDNGSSFIEISPLSIDPESSADFSIFGRYDYPGGKDEKKYLYRCLLVDSKSIPKDKLIRILQSWDAIYIHKKQKDILSDYLKNNLHFILDNDDIDIEKRSETLIRLSATIIKDAFDANFGFKSLSPERFKNIKQLVSQAVEFISSINSLKGLAKLIGHDYETHTHSVKVGWLIATFMNANQELFSIQSQSQLTNLLTHAAVAGFLHDIGKVKVPKNILNKRGRLNNLELVAVQAHTAYSLSLLFETDLPRSSMQGILYHHENEDGSGYPCGITGKEIPLFAKICHIADVFDALTSKRPYKEPKMPFEALQIMTASNPHLDVLNKLESEARQNIKSNLVALVRNAKNQKTKELKEKEIIAREEEKRVETRVKIRDQGMAHCFDQEILKKFISMLHKSESFDLGLFPTAE